MKDLVQNLEHVWALVQSQSSLIEMQRNREIQLRQQEQLEQSNRATVERETFAIIDKLSSASVETDQWEISRAWQNYPEFGRRLLHIPPWKQWLDVTNQKSVIWVKGSPGSGESS